MKHFIKLVTPLSLAALLVAAAAPGCAAPAEAEREAPGAAPSALVADAEASEALALKLDALASRGRAAAEWAQAAEGKAPDGTPYVAVLVTAAQPDGSRAAAKLYYVPGDEPRVIAVADAGPSRERLDGDIAALVGRGGSDVTTGAPSTELTAAGDACRPYDCTERTTRQGFWWACLDDGGYYVRTRRECGNDRLDGAGHCTIAGIAHDYCDNRATRTPGFIKAAAEWDSCGFC